MNVNGVCCDCFVVLRIWSDGGNGGAPWWSYWSAGITNTIGPAMGIEALKYISYPAQVSSVFRVLLVFLLSLHYLALSCMSRYPIYSDSCIAYFASLCY